MNLIACPENFDGSFLTAVVDKSIFEAPSFKENLKEVGVSIVQLKETTLATLQECLQYTCTAKLSPSWNILGNMLVQGTEFLTSNYPMKAVKMEIFVGAGEISLCLHPMCIRVPPLSMEELVDPDILATSRFLKLDEICHVLPSLKQAKIVSATKHIGVKSIFKNYNELQKHWKDMYGYLLPDVKENIWYLNVSFRCQNSTIYTYPELCVKPYGVIQIPRVDSRPSLVCFVKDFYKKIGNICGEKCKIVECRASFPSLDLYPAIAVREGMKPRPGTTFSMNSTTPYRKIGEVNACSASSQNLDVLQRKQFNHAYKNDSASFQKDLIKTNASFPESEEKYSNNNDMICEKDKQNYKKGVFISTNDKCLSKSDATTKYAPVFTPKEPKKKLLQMKITQCSNDGKRFAPSFFPIKKKSNRVISKSHKIGSVNKPKPLTGEKDKTGIKSAKKVKKTSVNIK